jgi:hypothetical protein
MNYAKYILLLIFSFSLYNNSNAQNLKSKPINTGYVFIDGEYIEPPYVIKVKGNQIYINNIIFDTTTIKQYKNPKKRIIVTEFPCYPPEGLLTLDEIIGYINPETGNLLYADVVTFYINTYGFKKAKELFLDYYCNLQGINCIQTEPYLQIQTESGGRLTIPWDQFYITKEQKGYKTEKERKDFFIGKQKFVLTEIEEYLLNGKCIFSNNKNMIISSVFNNKTSEQFIIEGIPIINDKLLDNKQKINKLKEKRFQFYTSDSIINQIINKGIKINQLNKRVNCKNSSYIKNTIKEYSPNNNDVVYFCPYTYDDAFNGTTTNSFSHSYILQFPQLL